MKCLRCHNNSDFTVSIQVRVKEPFNTPEDAWRCGENKVLNHLICEGCKMYMHWNANNVLVPDFADVMKQRATDTKLIQVIKTMDEETLASLIAKLKENNDG